MKNILTLLALLISVSGIGVSLAREEVRCLIGLDPRCQSRELPAAENPARKVVDTRPEPKAEEPPPEPETRVKEKSPPPEISEPVVTKGTDKGNTPEAIAEPSSQPLEVIPPPSGGQAIEVIPPPEN